MDVKLMKATAPILIQHLTWLLNQTLISSTFPDALKAALVHPIFKKGDTMQPSSYRPIAILPVFSKVIEKIISSQISRHFEKHALWSQSQFGFRMNKNTEQAILSLVNTVNNCFVNKEYCASEFVDLTKAFDCVPHNRLIDKLSYYNFGLPAKQLIDSYLRGRTQRVVRGGSMSKECCVLSGVPQGSILGPTLFLIYINDLPACIPGANMCLYADDTTIMACGPDRDDTADKAQTLRKLATTWFNNNGLTVNDSKSCSLILSKRATGEDRSISVRFLGVEIDAGLNWSNHCEMTAQKISKSLYLLRKLRESVSPKTLIISYFGLIHSRIKYAILAWGHAAGMQVVFKEQRRAIRIMAGIHPRQDCRESFKSLKIITAPSLYILECLVLAHRNKVFTKTSAVHNYSTRQKEDLRTSFCRLKSVQNSINHWAPKLFNRLPQKVRILEPRPFKNVVRHFLVEHSFYNMDEFMSCDMKICDM